MAGEAPVNDELRRQSAGAVEDEVDKTAAASNKTSPAAVPAIFYLPGLSSDEEADVARFIATRITRALDRTDASGATALATEIRDEQFGSASQLVRVSTIKQPRSTPKGSTLKPPSPPEDKASAPPSEGDPLLEIYQFDYRDRLRDDMQRHWLPWRLILTFGAFVVGLWHVLPRFILSLAPFQRRALSRLAQVQSVSSLAILACVFAYVFVLGLAVKESLNQWHVSITRTESAQVVATDATTQTQGQSSSGSEGGDWSDWGA